MGKTIPRSLRFVIDTLDEVEQEKWLGWYNNLAMPDKINVGRLLRPFHGWMVDRQIEREKRIESLVSDHGYDREGVEKSLTGGYFIFSAIGSTNEGPGYTDLDFLIVTNTLWRDLDVFQTDYLDTRLSPYFSYSIDPDIPEAYKGKWGSPRPARTKADLDPVYGTGRPIDITVQPEIQSEQYWRERDPEQFVVLYRSGNVNGFRDEVKRATDVIALLNLS